MRQRRLLPVVLAAAAMAEDAVGAVARPGLLGLRRWLSQSAANDSVPHPSPKLRRCWAEAEPREDSASSAAGAERHSISCDFVIPPHYNATVGIKFGTCSLLDEPICDDTEGGRCAGPYAISRSGKEVVTAVIYPEVSRDLLRANPQFEIEQTYCARADLFADVDRSGQQESIATAEREIVVTFKGIGVDEYTVGVEEEAGNNGDFVMANVIGFAIGVLVMAIVITCFLPKGKWCSSVGKTQHPTDMKGKSSSYDSKQKNEGMEIERDDRLEMI